MHKLLIICGPTATGKTKLALHLAQLFNAELISADSRQVYRGMDIGTGKDLTVNFEFRVSSFKFNTKKISYYTDGKTRIWGLDVVNPDEEFSVAHFRQYTNIVLPTIFARKKLPIIVGGTGLYIKSILEPLGDIAVPQNPSLRDELAHLSVSNLQERLLRVDEDRLDRMNNSDRNNPRRLIRAIEIGEYYKTHMTYKAHKTHTKDHLIIGLTAPLETLRKNISTRVVERMQNGMMEETVRLSKKYSFNLPSFSGTGYRLLIANCKLQIANREVKISEKVINQWIQEEYNYAKRQVTWFAKQKNIKWFDLTKNPQIEIVDFVRRWYTEK